MRKRGHGDRGRGRDLGVQREGVRVWMKRWDACERDRNIRKGMYVWVKVNSGEEEGPRGRRQV